MGHLLPIIQKKCLLGEKGGGLWKKEEEMRWSATFKSGPSHYLLICAEVEGADGDFGSYKAKLEGSCRLEKIVTWIQTYGNVVTAYLSKRYQESKLRLQGIGKAYRERGVRAIGHEETDLGKRTAFRIGWPPCSKISRNLQLPIRKILKRKRQLWIIWRIMYTIWKTSPRIIDFGWKYDRSRRG